jgi:hypothetical protein
LWRGSFKGRQSSTFWTLGCWSCRGRVKTTMYVYSCTYRHASPTRLYISLHIPKNITPVGLRRQRDMALLDSSDLFQSRRSTTTLHDDPIQTRHTCGSFPIDPRQYIPSLPSQIVLVTARRLLTRGCAIGSGANILHQTHANSMPISWQTFLLTRHHSHPTPYLLILPLTAPKTPAYTPSTGTM